MPEWVRALPPGLCELCERAMEADAEELDSLGMGGETLFSAAAEIVGVGGGVMLALRRTELAAWTQSRPGEAARMVWMLPLRRLQGAWWAEGDAEVLLYDSEEGSDVHLRLSRGAWARNALLGCLVAELGCAGWGLEVEETGEDPRGGPGGGRQVFFTPPPGRG